MAIHTSNTIVLIESFSDDYDWLAIFPDRTSRLFEAEADNLIVNCAEYNETLRPSGRKVITLTA